MKPISFIGALFLTACVTINIYFPAAAAEKVADEIIKEIQQEDGKNSSPQKEQKPVEPQASQSDFKMTVYPAPHNVPTFMARKKSCNRSFLKQELFFRTRCWVYQSMGYLLDFIVTPAQAAADLSVDSPEIRRIQSRMRQRFPQLVPLYNQGWIGIKADGFLTVRGKVPLRERNKVNKLVAAENADRRSLYQAIANANGHPEWYGQIKDTFAARWVSHAHSGWWYQRLNGQWTQK